MIFDPSTAPAEVLVALAQLETHPDFQTFRDYLVKCREGERQTLETKPMPDPAEFGRQQGRTSFIGQLVDFIAGARARYAERVRINNQRQPGANAQAAGGVF